MGTPGISVEGTLQPDGVTLNLEQKVALPPGRVWVWMQPAEPTSGLPMLAVLEHINQAQKERGWVPMTEEVRGAEIAQSNAEAEEEEDYWRHIWAQTGPTGRVDG